MTADRESRYKYPNRDFRRRPARWQYTLWSTFVVTTLCACALSIYVINPTFALELLCTGIATIILGAAVVYGLVNLTVMCHRVFRSGIHHRK